MFYGEKKARTVDEDLRGVLTAAIDKALADTATPDAASAAAAFADTTVVSVRRPLKSSLTSLTRERHLKKAGELVQQYASVSGIFNGRISNPLASEIFPLVQRRIFAKQLLERLEAPYSTHQGPGWLCGPAAATHTLLNYDPLNYFKLAVLLYETGSGQVESSTKEIKVSDGMRGVWPDANGLVKMFPDEDNEKDKMGIVDYILLGALRSTLNGDSKSGVGIRNLWAARKDFDPVKDFDPLAGDKRSSGTWPMEMHGMLAAYYGFSVPVYGYYRSGNTELRKTKKALEDGMGVILFIDNNLQSMAADKKRRAKKGTDIFNYIGVHFVFVTANSRFEVDPKVEFAYWDYGGRVTHVETTVAQFSSSVKGYWCIKPKYV